MAQQWQKDLPEAQGSKLNPTSNEKTLWRSSPFIYVAREYTVRVKARWDDTCGSGSNSFYCCPEVVLGGTDRMAERCDMSDVPNDILEAIPKDLLALEKWNGCHPFGPWYYIENTVYLAGNLDHDGLALGEKRQIRNGKIGNPIWRLTKVNLDYSEIERGLPEYIDSPTQPLQEYLLVYRPWYKVGNGKEREFDSARRAAIWPDATDEELSVPKEELVEKLKARLPGLLVEFRRTIESLGFTW